MCDANNARRRHGRRRCRAADNAPGGVCNNPERPGDPIVQLRSLYRIIPTDHRGQRFRGRCGLPLSRSRLTDTMIRYTIIFHATAGARRLTNLIHRWTAATSGGGVHAPPRGGPTPRAPTFDPDCVDRDAPSVAADGDSREARGAPDGVGGATRAYRRARNGGRAAGGVDGACLGLSVSRCGRGCGRGVQRRGRDGDDEGRTRGRRRRGDGCRGHGLGLEGRAVWVGDGGVVGGGGGVAGHRYFGTGTGTRACCPSVARGRTARRRPVACVRVCECGLRLGEWLE